MSMHLLDSASDLRTLLAKHSLGAALVYSDWCPFSLLAKIAFELVEHEFPDVAFAKVRLDNIDGEQLPFRVGAIPTILFWRDTRFVDTLVGLPSLAHFRDYFARVFGDKSASSQTLRAVGLPILPKAPTYRLSLTLPPNLMNYRLKVSVEVVLKGSGEVVGQGVTNRSNAHFLLFLAHARAVGAEHELFRSGVLTDQAKRLLTDLKRKYGILGRLSVVEDMSNSKDDQYLAKRVHRTNRDMVGFFGDSNVRVICRDGEDFVLDKSIEFIMERSR